jgi:hypothetical protein
MGPLRPLSPPSRPTLVLDPDRARVHSAFLDETRSVARYSNLCVPGTFICNIVERALDDALGHDAPANDEPWARLVRAVDDLLEACPAARMLPAGRQLERFVAENADLLQAAPRGRAG